VNIFNVLSRHVDWLGQRYQVASNNVAHSDSPGYRASQISGFQNQLDSLGGLELARTSPMHLSVSGGTDDGSPTYETSLQNNTDVSHSGNDVVIEKEMATLGDTSRMMAFDAGIERTFQRMYMSSVKA
jgi:flagellar basal-body rod protein FlgB